MAKDWGEGTKKKLWMLLVQVFRAWIWFSASMSSLRRSSSIGAGSEVRSIG